MHRVVRFWPIVILVLFFMVGCPNGEDEPGEDGCDNSTLPAQSTGSRGERVSFASLSNGAGLPCSGLTGGNTCTFSVAFAAPGLATPATAQLLVEITTAADGSAFSGVFPQAETVAVTPAQPTGSLMGSLGPPVSTRVRLNLAIVLRDATGLTIASSGPVCDLRPQ